MQMRQIDSAVFPTEDAARASIDGVLASLGQEGEFEVVSVTVKEVQGGWVAVLVVSVSEPEPEADEDSEGGGEDRSLGVPEDVEEQFNRAIPLWGHHSVLDDAQHVGEAFQEEPVHEAMHDIEPEQESYEASEEDKERVERENARGEDILDTTNDVSDSAPESRADLREELATDFQESAPPTPTVSPNLYLTEEEMRDLPEEDRRRLAELRAQPQAPAPAPENTA